MNYVEVILNVGIFMFIKLMWKMENGFPKMVFPKRFFRNGFPKTVFPKTRQNDDPKNRYF